MIFCAKVQPLSRKKNNGVVTEFRCVRYKGHDTDGGIQPKHRYVQHLVRGTPTAVDVETDVL